jgi:CheY-like chemotaxis protein
VETTNLALIVEDHPSMHRFLAAKLVQTGWQVTQASNALEGLEALKVNPPALITLDLIMHPVGGVTSLDLLLAAAQLSPMPAVFVLTSKASYEDRKAFLAAGAKQVFLKPVLAASGFEPLFSEIKKLHYSSDSRLTDGRVIEHGPSPRSTHRQKIGTARIDSPGGFAISDHSETRTNPVSKSHKGTIVARPIRLDSAP